MPQDFWTFSALGVLINLPKLGSLIYPQRQGICSVNLSQQSFDGGVPIVIASRHGLSSSGSHVTVSAAIVTSPRGATTTATSAIIQNTLIFIFNTKIKIWERVCVGDAMDEFCRGCNGWILWPWFWCTIYRGELNFTIFVEKLSSASGTLPQGAPNLSFTTYFYGVQDCMDRTGHLKHVTRWCPSGTE